MKCSAMFRKGRRVKYNKVVYVIGIIQKLECIFTICLVTFITWEVQLYVCVSQLDSLCAAVNGMYRLRSASHSIERETTCIAEHVEYRLSL